MVFLFTQTWMSRSIVILEATDTLRCDVSDECLENGISRAKHFGELHPRPRVNVNDTPRHPLRKKPPPSISRSGGLGEDSFHARARGSERNTFVLWPKEINLGSELNLPPAPEIKVSPLRRLSGADAFSPPRLRLSTPSCWFFRVDTAEVSSAGCFQRARD